MIDVKISIIVPVYNVEKYLHQCLDSVVNQTLKEIEIICVNDGSTDKSRQILSQYAQNDARIIIVDQENQGLSAARNTGMRIAKGEYIGFVDSDDWIDETMYEKLYHKAMLFNSEIVLTGVHKFDDEGKKVVDDDPYFTLGYFNSSFDNVSFNHNQTKEFLFEFCVMAWNKIYKRSFLEEHDAKFPHGLIFEDGPFFHHIFYKMEKIALVRENLYFYRVNRENSIIKRGGKNYTDIFDVIELIFNEIKDLPYFDEVKYDFFNKKFDDAKYRFTVIDKRYRKDYYYKFKNFKIFNDERYFDKGEIKKRFYYLYEVMEDLKENNYLGYETRDIRIRFKNRIKYKIMEVIYYKDGYYTLKYYKNFWFFKKRANIFDVWYCNDCLHFNILRKVKFNIKFNYSELEKRANEYKKNISHNSL